MKNNRKKCNTLKGYCKELSRIEWPKIQGALQSQTFFYSAYISFEGSNYPTQEENFYKERTVGRNDVFFFKNAQNVSSFLYTCQ